MPRNKQFDVEVVLDRAKETFWQRGYEATSMAELLDEMGINRGSFYDTFQSKRALLLDALRRYDEMDRHKAIQAVAEGRPPREAILRIFRGMIDARRIQSRHGCFLVNSALELAPADPEVAGIVRAGFRDIERFFADLVRLAQKSHQISRRLDPAETGRALMNHLLGLMVLVRARSPRSTLQSVVAQVQRLLE